MAKQKPRRRKGQPYLSHGSEGRVQIGHRLVPDPLEPGAMLPVAVNVRESAIDEMRNRNRINAAQAEAGERFRRVWERASVGRSKAIDTTKEYVDGGLLGDPLTDDLIQASKELREISQSLGMIGASMLVLIIGQGVLIRDVARRWSDAGGIVSGNRAEGYISARFIEALDDLVRLWKLEATGIRHEGIRVSSDGHVGPATEVSVGRFGDIQQSQSRPVDRSANMAASGTVK